MFVIIEGINAAQLYTTAHNGVQHLFNVRSLFTGGHNHATGFLDATKLQQAQQEFIAAHNDFQQLHAQLDRDAVVGLLDFALPQQVTSVRALSQIGQDVADIGLRLTYTAGRITPTMQGPLLAAKTNRPLITPAALALFGTTVDSLLPRINDILSQSRLLTLSSLPMSEHQRQQFTLLLAALPQGRIDLAQGRALLNAIGWVLGVDQPRTFLIQTMDRTELRPTGGFTGQYGELKIIGGRIAPFSLHDISLVEYASENPTAGKAAPQAYRSWWPFANWGIRDSNLSADFPTSARLAINLYEQEVGHRVDGNIVFSPFLITHVLQITGPIRIPAYGETISAQNLEARLHYYQLDNKGIRKEEIVEKVPNTPDAPTLARKLFTARLAHTLINQVRQAPPDEIIAIAREMLHALQTKDLQIYVTNPNIESLLARYDAAGAMDRSRTHDGIFIVQANLSASKASQYVQTTFQDVVTLDAQRGALHQLRMHFNYRQRGPVYGLDTYRDYIRVYVPPTAHFVNGNGFDSGQALCGGVLGSCPLTGLAPQNDLVCPPGGYDVGASAPMLGDPYQGRLHPLDRTGPPTNMQSDEPGRAMFGGWVVIPKNCTLTVTLSWYVPALGQAPYTLLFQRQSGTSPVVDLTIQVNAAACRYFAARHLHVLDGRDILLTFPSHRTKTPSSPGCSTQPGL
jgi:hypothetical protein